jgi:hypothetical protein
MSSSFTTPKIPTPFVVFALPRSRTAWLSKFLSFKPWVCGHEQIRYWRTLEDAKSWFMQPYIGTAETIGGPFWRLLPRYAPDCRVLVIRRPVEQVVESMMAHKIGGVDKDKLAVNMGRLNAKLDQIEARCPNTLSVDFEELADFRICQIVFEHCLGQLLPPQWWEYWNQINVQIDLDAAMRYVYTHMAHLLRLNLAARHQMMADLIASPRPDISNGLDIAEERFPQSFKEAQAMFEDHCVAVGEPPDEWTRNNIELLYQMDAVGKLQILTARSNGKLFGYLVSMLGESLDSATAKSATHTLFYASDQWPGAGLRLQREALRRLKEKGFNEVLMRSGLGPGARVETIYKRIGADFDGKIFRIKLDA